MPSVVGTSTNYDPISWSNQQKGFFAAGRFWVFYTDGTNAGYESTVDPDDWSAAATSIGACTVGQNLAVWFDGTYVHYVRYDAYKLYYRRGTPESDGTITWSAGEQLVFDGISTSYCDRPCVAVDTDGRAYISVRKYNGATYLPFVLRNANVDGTWSTDSSEQLNATSSANWRLTIVSLTASKVYVVYTMNALLYGRLYNGGWGSAETDLADYNVRSGYQYTVVALGDDVYLAYCRVTTLQLRYNKRVYGVGWGVNDVLVQDAVETSAAPVLCINPWDGALCLFWARIDTDHVYYKRCVGGVWDADPIDWIDESADGIYAPNFVNSFREVCSNRAVLLYTTKLATPYNLKFASLVVGTAHYVTCTEIFGASDSKTRSKTVHRTLTELVGALDAKTRARSIFRTFTELFGGLDSKTRAKSVYRTFTELFGGLDARTRVKSIFRTFTEKLSLSDTFSKTKGTAAPAKQWGYSVPFSVFRKIGLSGAVIRPQQENVKLKAGLLDRKALSCVVHGKALNQVSMGAKINVSGLLRKRTLGLHGISVVRVGQRSTVHGHLLRPAESSAKVVGKQRFDLAAGVLGLLESTYTYMFVAVVDDTTCQKCMQHDTKTYTQDDIAKLFPYAQEIDYSLIMPNIHKFCRCMLVLLEIGA